MTTARPPWAPIEMGMLAGRDHEPCRRTSAHHRHEEAGATMMWTGSWKRPHSYGDVAGEVRAVREQLGVIDVSTLGKILVKGPDAGAFLDRVYPNRFSDLKPGRIRYGVLTTDSGRIMDDGTVARLDEDTFYVTTTSTGADSVYQWFTWWNAVWFMEPSSCR
jgi:sarcosine oxidase subunit alpha